MKVLQGNGVASGIALGHVIKLDRGVRPVFKIHLGEDAVRKELAGFDEALATTGRQLAAVQEKLARELGREHSLMIQAHILILQDVHFSGAMREIILQEKVNAEWAVKVVRDRIQHVYENLEDSYLREKIHDIQDIAQRLLGNIAGQGQAGPDASYENLIVVNHEVNLSLLADLNIKHLKGFAVDSGGWTAHASIIARALNIPTVVNLENITNQVQTGDFVILDGETGTVYVDPDAATIEEFRNRQAEASQAREEAIRSSACANGNGMPGVRIYLNTEFPVELTDFKRLGVEGVGLFRSEFLFLGRRMEDISAGEHEAIYRELAEKTAPGIANIRTFDFGLEKLPELSGRYHEANPALGLRGIRLSLHFEDFFRRQLRGILRANGRGNLRVLFPFVSSLEEVQAARRILNSVAAEEGLPPNPMPAGIMLEIPSTFLILDSLAAEADFFILGTNDLLQYTLARDRNDILRTSDFWAAHPAMRRAMSIIRQGAEQANRPLMCCGEMASHPLLLLLLLGLGYCDISVNRPSLPLVRYVLHQVTPDGLSRLMEEWSKCRTLAEIEELFLFRLVEFFPVDFVRTVLKACHRMQKSAPERPEI